MKQARLGAFLAALVTCVAFCVHAETEIIDRIVAVVNGEIITLSELKKFQSLMSMGMPDKARGGDVERMMLDQMIEKELIAQEAPSMEIEVREKDVDQAIQDILERNKISLQQMKEHLAKDSITVEEYRQLIKNEILLSEVVGQQIQSRISINDKEMERYYDKNIRPQQKPGMRVHIQQILLVVPRDSSDEDIVVVEKSAAEVREKIISGADFQEMAMAYSQGPAAQGGGDLGYFHKGELLPAVEEVAFSMEVNQVSPVIKTPMGFHIIKLIDKDSGEHDRSWKAHEDEIKMALYNREFEQRYTEWMQGLKQKAYIEIQY